MSSLVLSELVTLDGVMEAPGGEPTHRHTGWAASAAPVYAPLKFQEARDAECLLLGRVTYESFAEGWSTGTGEFADRMNGMPKYVVSSTLTDPAWTNTTVLPGDAVPAVAALKERSSGQVVLLGSATLCHALIPSGLIDEYRLMVFPVALGSGTRLFPDTERLTSLELVDATTLDGGVALLTYRPRR